MSGVSAPVSGEPSVVDGLDLDGLFSEPEQPEPSVLDTSGPASPNTSEPSHQARVIRGFDTKEQP